MVENTSLERKVILSYVKHLRMEYLIKHTDLTCEKAFIPLQNILTNFENLSQMIGVQSPQEISKNLSRSDINFGAEMFIALNSCPSINVKLYWKAIYGSESRIAKFTSNIIRKAKDDFKVKAQKIFGKISTILGFQKNMLDIEGEGENFRTWQYFELLCMFLFIDKMLFQTVSNHPVHILNEEGNLSPSSFIPFCYFGEEFIGASIKGFKIPVCNIFKPKNYLDQLCYETNLQDLKDSQKIGKQLEKGLTLVLDFNEERQFYNIMKENKPQTMNALYPDNDNVAIYLDTISL